jgi:CheY-like chemotaxis protein
VPTQPPITLVNTVTEKTQHARVGPPGGALGAQAAFVRALVDEVESHHPEGRLVVALRDQLSDELTRLAQLIEQNTCASSEAQSANTGPIDILVIDDDDATLHASVTVLRSLGYPCRTARSAEEALHEFDRQPAEIILSDWIMPGMSGLELCVALKGHALPPYAILMTALHDNARLLDGVRGGVDDFLRKPIDVDELEARLVAASRLIRALRTITNLGERMCSDVRREAG